MDIVVSLHPSSQDFKKKRARNVRLETRELDVDFWDFSVSLTLQIIKKKRRARPVVAQPVVAQPVVFGSASISVGKKESCKDGRNPR